MDSSRVQFKVVPREIVRVVKFLKHLVAVTIDYSLNLLMIKVIKDMHEEIPKALELNADEKDLLDILRRNPGLMNCFMEMAEIADDKVEGLILGDDAEEATVESMHRIGQATLQGWAERRCKAAEEEVRGKENCRPHVKKSPLEHFNRTNRGRSTKLFN